MQRMEDAIRERAYQIWVESGFEHGNADGHWLAAQRDILSTSLGEFGRVKSSQPEKIEKPKKARAPKKKRAA
jgi:Protein of unknown function (DUF2934)